MVALSGSLEMIVKLVKRPLEVYKDIPRAGKDIANLWETLWIVEQGNCFLICGGSSLKWAVPVSFRRGLNCFG